MQYRNFFCNNCGKNGHESRSCREPVTSYGIINFDISDTDIEKDGVRKIFIKKYKQEIIIITSRKFPDIKCQLTANNIPIVPDIIQGIECNTNEEYERLRYYRNRIKFLMVSRRYSLAFISFIRGKYDIDDSDTITQLIEQMTSEEIKLITENNYDDILYLFLNRRNESVEIVLNRVYGGKYANEYYDAKNKFAILQGMALTTNDPKKPIINVTKGLSYYVATVKPKWKDSEWGFPKGRREKKSETNMECACREFQEETGYRNYAILDKLVPWEETMKGTNQVIYRHVYYLSIEMSLREEFSNYDPHEIGSLKWMTYEEAFYAIRPHHLEKRMLLTRIYLFILNTLIKYT